MVDFLLVLLAGVWTAYEHSREGCLDVVGSRDAVMWMLGAVVAKAGDVAIACGITS